MSRLHVRLASIAALLLLFGFLTAANFVSEETRLASPLLPDSGLRLGLDLQGGIHWVLGVKLEVAEKHELEFQAKNVERLAEDEDFSLDEVSIVDGRLVVTGVSGRGAELVREWASDHGGLRVESDEETRLEIGGGPAQAGGGPCSAG